MPVGSTYQRNVGDVRAVRGARLFMADLGGKACHAMLLLHYPCLFYMMYDSMDILH